MAKDGVHLEYTPIGQAVISRDQITVIDIVSGERLESHPAELVIVDDLDKYRYSHSFIKNYAQCHAKGYFQRMKAPALPAYALERGIVCHEAIEAFEKDPSIDIVKKFDELWKQRLVDRFKEFSDDDKQKINYGYEESKLIVEDWHWENHELIESGDVFPEDIEVEFDLPVTFTTSQGTFKRRFKGKLDIVLWNKDRSRYRILDYKTSYNAPSEAELALDPQFSLYQWAATQLFGFPPESMWWYHLKGKHKSPEEHDPPLLNKKTGEPLKQTPQFSETHPRTPECLKFAFLAPLRDQAVIDNYLNNFVAGEIIEYESGNVTKTGLADPDQCLHFCQYKQFCDNFQIPLPKHVRIGNP